MQLISIEINNIKVFKGTHNITLKNLNLFQGENGEGKSTIIIDSILFVLYGYTTKTMNSLITKGTKSGWVNIYLEHNNKSYSITREIPSKLTIIEDGVDIKGSIPVKDKYLVSIFNDLTWFRKFRLFDVTSGINILEESNLSLRKTLLSFNEDKLNIIREKLLAIKKEREIYNRSNIDMLPYAPSEKRKSILTKGIEKFKSSVTPTKNNINKSQEKITALNYELGGKTQDNRNLNKKVDNVSELVICPHCHQKVTNKHKAEVAKSVKDLVNKNLIEIENIKKQIEENTLELNKNIAYQEKYNERLFKAQDHLNKLEQRLKQKDYIWTNKDVEVIKRSINELDSFYSFYLNETISSLEPVINHILKKIGYVLKFCLNKKGEFTFYVIINKTEFEYKELSTGQRLMVSMAFKMALLLEKGESGLIISDEGMSSLSENNLKLMFELILGFPFQLLAVVHRYENPASFLNVFDINKGKITNV